MKSRLCLTLILIAGSCFAANTPRVWTDTQGRKTEASFVRLEGSTVYIRLAATGAVFPLPLDRLSAEDQKLAKTLKPEPPAEGLSAKATVAEAAARIDEIVEAGFQRGNAKLLEAWQKQAEADAKAGKKSAAFVQLKANPMSSDEQFVRRAYLDIIGRIPNFDEASAFLHSTAADRRARLIDKLLNSDGYISHSFNYFSEMLRVKDDFGMNLVRGLSYIQWLKDQIKANRPWNEMAHDMVTAEGPMWTNGASGYLLRDSGMPLDNLSYTLQVFLGTDLACAQCHDHPFAEWTQKQFYEMAAFFGSTSTQLNANDFPKGDPNKRIPEEVTYLLKKTGKDPATAMGMVNDVINANRFAVANLNENRTKLPADYRYKDAKGGESVAPKLIKWSPSDETNKAYLEVVGKEKSIENLRKTFAAWMTHPANPRFAMTMANRLWARALGRSITASIRNIDNPDEASNPELLRHLATELVRVKFDMKAFQRIIFNTRTYQREATTEALALGEPYYFQGPVLRRMTAEQAWDSFMTLVLGDPDKIKSTEADLYGRALEMNLNTVDAVTVLQKINAVQTIAQKQQAKMVGGLADANAKGMGDSILSFEGMKLMRASELPQPAPAGHFLREFGQSDRMTIDGGSREGSSPQVLMLMNGAGQKMLTNKDSLILRTMEKVKSPADKVEVVFMSILSRKPTFREKDITKKQLAEHGDTGYQNIIWALINTREFCFVQ
jgi:Protein of unknown function (DUF1553)/Protein of unknown function (DUF1549)